MQIHPLELSWLVAKNTVRIKEKSNNNLEQLHIFHMILFELANII